MNDKVIVFHRFQFYTRMGGDVREFYLNIFSLKGEWQLKIFFHNEIVLEHGL